MSWKACAYVKDLRKDLGVTEKFVLLMLAEYHRTDGKNEWPGTELLADDCLMTERALRQVLKRLAEKGFIRRNIGGGRGHVTRYQIAGVDYIKAEAQTGITETGFQQTGIKTLINGAVNRVSGGSPYKVLPVNHTGEEIPPDLHSTQYAAKIIQELGMTHTRPNLNAATAAFDLVFREGKSKPSAYEFLLAQALDARERGEVVNRWWFEDAKWKQTKPTAAKLSDPSEEARRQLSEQRKNAN